MRGIFAILALVLLGNASAVPDAIELNDGRGPRVFEVACDELHCRPTEDAAHSRPIALQTDARSTADFAATVEEAAGGSQFDLVLYESGKPRESAYRRVLNRRILITLANGVVPKEIAEAVGAQGWTVPSYSADHAILHFAGAGDALDKLAAVSAHFGVAHAEPILASVRTKRYIPNDPLFSWSSSTPSYQWHLRNTGQNGGISGHDVNITSAWDDYAGNDVTIAIVDDGLQVAHPDLAPNVNTAIDHNWNDGPSNDPTPTNTFDDHGTSCAGVAAARGDNNIGGVGAAPFANLVGLRLIAAAFGPDDAAEALGWRTDVIDISSNSWGEPDTGTDLWELHPLVKSALQNGVANGRDGKGSIYVWAGGNGRLNNDRSNYEGYNNAPETISVAAVNDIRQQSWYSEPGANLLVSAPSNGTSNDQGITTTTLTSNGSYLHDFGGTSSATPLVSGCIALMLQANPDLGWRDVQEILITSAERINPTSTGWEINGANLRFNHAYGAGMVDASAAVALAETWVNLPSRQTRTSSSTPLNIPIPDNDLDGISHNITIGGTDLRVEHVELTVDIDHTYRGDLVIELTSPDGTVSEFTKVHDDFNVNIDNYTFLSVRNWGEMSNGTWTVKIADGWELDTGALRGLSLRVSGSVPLTGYELWVLEQFDKASAEDPDISGPCEDPDGDGRHNLMEYACGGDPEVPDTVGTPQFIDDNGTFRLRYVVDTSADDLTYRPKYSPDGVTWFNGSSSLVSTNGNWQTRQMTLFAGDERFARLDVTH